MARKNTSHKAGTVMKTRDQIILPREEIFEKLWEGKKVKLNQMFSTIPYFSPTGRKREMVHDRETMNDYNRRIL